MGRDRHCAQRDPDERHAREDSTRTVTPDENMFAVIGRIIRSSPDDVRRIRNEAREINERIQALGRAYNHA
jgi:Mg2+ and Co2+ transporter CorA